MKRITHDEQGFVVEQGGAYWKNLRVGLFTGTGIGDLMPGERGVKKARDDQIDEVITELLTGKPSGGFFATKYVKDGIEREPFAKMLYTERTGNMIEEVAFVRHDWLRAGMSPDGEIVGRRKNVEVKSPKDRTHMRYLQLKECPQEYRIQVAVQQWLGEYEETDFISYHPDFDERLQLHVITVPRNEALIKQIEDEVMKAHAEVNVRMKFFKQLIESRGE